MGWRFFLSFSVHRSVFLEAMPLGIQEKPCVVAARPKAALIIETGLCPFALALAKKRAKVNGRKAGMCLFHMGDLFFGEFLGKRREPPALRWLCNS